jgi:hypothetical protein
MVLKVKMESHIKMCKSKAKTKKGVVRKIFRYLDF